MHHMYHAHIYTRMKANEYLYTHIHIQHLHSLRNISIFICNLYYTHTCAFTYIYLHIDILMHIHTGMYIPYTHMNTYKCTCIHRCTHMHMYTYLYIYIHKDAQMYIPYKRTNIHI